MIEVVYGDVNISSEGILSLRNALVLYDEQEQKSLSGDMCEDILLITQMAFPQVDWDKRGHLVSGCMFQRCTFNIENE